MSIQETTNRPSAAAQTQLKSGHTTDSEEETAAVDESEFAITVRKLEIPVRPRGVLAE